MSSANTVNQSSGFLSKIDKLKKMIDNDAVSENSERPWIVKEFQKIQQMHAALQQMQGNIEDIEGAELTKTIAKAIDELSFRVSIFLYDGAIIEVELGGPEDSRENSELSFDENDEATIEYDLSNEKNLAEDKRRRCLIQ